MERFGAKLRQLREDRGMTQKEFASLFEVNRATIGHYESNISYPSADVLVKMANYFHITVDQLLGRTTADPNLFEGLTEEQIDSLEEIVRQYRILNSKLPKEGNKSE